ASQKMMEPRYRGVPSEDIPEVRLPGGAAVRVIAGAVGRTRGPVRDIVIDPEYLDVTLPSGSRFDHPTKPGHTVVAYVIEGQGLFSAAEGVNSFDFEPASYFDFERSPALGNGSVVLFEDGDRVEAAAGDAAVRFLLFSGRPLREPVAWQGPIVMNTQEELRTAFREFRAGKFIRGARSG
ncbi:MAG: pirin family protein, partial [Candidatus Aminicenantes bacterium]|nr:pirin family protein [Candidatus Aminicenantes bacterium]